MAYRTERGELQGGLGEQGERGEQGELGERDELDERDELGKQGELDERGEQKSIAFSRINRRPQHMLVLYLALPMAFLFALVAAAMDIRITCRGIFAGIAVEGNPWIVAVFSDRPSMSQLCLYEIGRFLVLSLPLLFLITQNPLFSLTTGAYIALGIKHIQGYRLWRKLGA